MIDGNWDSVWSALVNQRDQLFIGIKQQPKKYGVVDNTALI